jgi:hypothetical protein
VADAIGQRLSRLSERVQVMAVTHAPQVAARAQSHFLIAKEPVPGSDRVATRVTPLAAKPRREEIARMLAGATITDEAGPRPGASSNRRSARRSWPGGAPPSVSWAISGAPPTSSSSTRPCGPWTSTPRVVPEAVKLTVVNLLKDHAIGDEPAPQAYPAAAEILGYCMLGSELFVRANGEDALARAERRIEACLDSGEGLDARIVLLAIHAKVIQPAVVERFGLESG